MISDNRILSILNSAVMAPSGDNCQPWRFEIKNSIIRIFNIPDKDASPYNFLQRSSLIAHGALIENAMIAARALGFGPELRLFPEKSTPDLIAEIELHKDSPKSDPLYEFIPKRTTNRKRYNASSLTTKEKNTILNQSLWFPHLGLKMADTDLQKDALISAMSLNDMLIFENNSLHNFFYEHLRWSEKEATKTRDSISIKTLELHPFKKILLLLAKNWGLMKLMNRFGLSKIAWKNAKELCTSSSLYMITAPDDSALNYIDSGRLMQRVWLQAAQLGLSLHVMSGIALLIQRVVADEGAELSAKNIHDIKASNISLRTAFGLTDEAMTACFRIGRSSSPSSTSPRIPAEDITTTL